MDSQILNNNGCSLKDTPNHRTQTHHINLGQNKSNVSSLFNIRNLKEFLCLRVASSFHYIVLMHRYIVLQYFGHYSHIRKTKFLYSPGTDALQLQFSSLPKDTVSLVSFSQVHGCLTIMVDKILMSTFI